MANVSELEQAAALKYLYSWLRHHPKYGTLARPEMSDSLYHADVRVYSIKFEQIVHQTPVNSAMHMTTENTHLIGFFVLLFCLRSCTWFDMAQVGRLFNEAAQMSPEDADVHVVLGVLFNLSREFDKAIASFKTALKLKPRDYSLWNKLGATQANSVQSADAIDAYQQVILI